MYNSNKDSLTSFKEDHSTNKKLIDIEDDIETYLCEQKSVGYG